MNTNVLVSELSQEKGQSVIDEPVVEEIEELQLISEGMAESVLEASDEELLQEVREAGGDPVKESEDLRQILLNTVRAQTPQHVVTVQSPAHGRQ